MNQLRPGMPPLPSRMSLLPISDKGYPVPRFVEWIEGKPDFRVMDANFWRLAIRRNLCWLCGEPLGRFKTFVIGPMCAVNRTSAEPPCHADCATFSAMACPFLTLPKAVRRDANMPEGTIEPGGVMLKRNPGVALLWTCVSYEVFRPDPSSQQRLIKIGPATAVAWYAQGRPATRAEVLESISSGLPALQEMASAEGDRAAFQLGQQVGEAMKLIPEEA